MALQQPITTDFIKLMVIHIDFVAIWWAQVPFFDYYQDGVSSANDFGTNTGIRYCKELIFNQNLLHLIYSKELEHNSHSCIV